MKKILRYLFSCVLFFTSVGVYCTNRLMYMKKKEENFIYNRELEAGRINPANYEAIHKQELKILSPYGYYLTAIIVEPKKSDRYIIISHGVTENKINSIKYMNLFLERGFNVLIYDHRRHGQSGGKTTSFGYYEKNDLKAVVDWVRKKKGEDILLGIHGESMGAATMILYAGMLEDGADFYIADCPFSDFSEEISYLISSEIKLPAKMILPIADLFLKIREKYSIRDVSPIRVIDKITKPMLFIHSEKDDFILPEMTKKLFEKKKGPKKLLITANGMHAQSYNENKEAYEKAVDEFFAEYVFKIIG
ncbi:alpha/beta hydrolase [Niallia sp. NCCP-28]|uniref:alpha/beta hydrolase n=1 Tax=Niallia sp. NCCP-28 TaxID=2934712 RepID=UPI0020802CAA|nr:alpha/beta hydrolase [Niallia sp. NCCP-28]GKU81094.1 alpha/beta hydrolase [Niallia sp. NCCP-28]